MLGIIRYVAHNPRNMYILWDDNGDLSFKRYRNIVDTLRDSLLIRFERAMSIDGFRGDIGEDYRFQKLLSRRMPPRNATHEEAQLFCNGFVDSIYLKAHEDMPWKDYFEIMQSPTSKEDNPIHTAFLDALLEDPELVGIYNTSRTFSEVRFLNQFGNNIRKNAYFFRFLSNRKEPKENTGKPLVGVDGIFVTPNVVYILEAKTQGFGEIGATGDGSKRSSRYGANKQLLAASSFVYHNWLLPVITVRTTLENHDGDLFYKHTHHYFNPKTTSLDYKDHTEKKPFHFQRQLI
tara:strand:+ start:3111 stop:3983 length:873 start_codon:yes stop_codon:yes gene_type:complete